MRRRSAVTIIGILGSKNLDILVPEARTGEEQGLQLFSCDFNCGFYGGFEDVSAHERSCELNPCITLGEVWA